MASKVGFENVEELKRIVETARGGLQADLVIKNASFLDILGGSWLKGDIAIADGVIVGTCETYSGKNVIDGSNLTVVPGFIDSHVHIESSLLTPSGFERAVLPRGTTTAIWDPHEIANVRGKDGLSWAFDAVANLKMDVFIVLPSCVPSTSPELLLETSGATLRSADLTEFRGRARLRGLAEMMNFPGVLHEDADVMQKLIQFANMPKDGHCPLLRGRNLNAYAAAGLMSCHESVSLEEAREKLAKGLHVWIRQGSCAKNASALLPLLDSYTASELGFCTDDRNALDIEQDGHIDAIVQMALQRGISPFAVFKAACLSPARAYGLMDRGVVAPGYRADLNLLHLKQPDDWTAGFEVDSVIKSGRVIQASDLQVAPSQLDDAAILKWPTGMRARNVNVSLPITACNLLIPSSTTCAAVKTAGVNETQARVIGLIAGQIVTRSDTLTLPVQSGQIQPLLAQDVLKLAVLERHHGSNRTAAAFVQGFGLTAGAIAMTVAHDAHNVIAVGVDDASIIAAITVLVRADGGIVVWASDDKFELLPLPIGGLMSDESPAELAKRLRRLKEQARVQGCRLDEPFIQLSFLALPVIPHLKLTDRGLIDTEFMRIVPVACDKK